MFPYATRRPLPPELARGLRRAGLVEAKADQAIAWLVWRKEAPGAPAFGRPWIWLTPTRPPIEARLAAGKAGAYDTIDLATPGAVERLKVRLAELAARRIELPRGSGLLGKSPAAERIREQIALAAQTSMPVMITGETGTGKEVAARLIHQWSRRREHPFVPLNCAAIPNELMEAELFGYKKGAFSGAERTFDGQLMAGAGGTVFLDEIDDTPVSTQVKLLRVLEDRVVTRIGESEPHQVDFRLLAATNRDPRALVRSGVFGEDFYERLAIVSIHLPPLRDRREDVPELAHHFVARYHQLEPDRTRKVEAISEEALAALSAHDWPGNIRELRNVIYASLVEKRSGHELLLADLPKRILDPPRARSAGPDPAALEARIALGGFNLKAELEALERTALEVALAQTGGSPTQAARLLGEVGRGRARDPGGTVRAMIRRLGLDALPEPR